MLNRMGFTLLELLVVLLLIALIAGLTTPFLMSTLDRVRSQSSVKEIATIFRYARSKAITEKVPYIFNANIDNNQYWLTNARTKVSYEIRKLDPSLKIFEFSDVEETITEGIFQIFFYPQGNTSGGNILVALKKSGISPLLYDVTLDTVTGKPDVQRND